MAIAGHVGGLSFVMESLVRQVSKQLQNGDCGCDVVEQMRVIAAVLPPFSPGGGGATPVNPAEENLRSVRSMLLSCFARATSASSCALWIMQMWLPMLCFSR